MIKHLFLTIFIMLVTVSFSANVFADEHSKKQVSRKITKVEKKLEKLSEVIQKEAGREVAKVENYVRNAKKFLDDNDRDEAWWEIGKANAYFKVINAKWKLKNVKDELSKEVKRYKAAKKKSK